MPQWKSQNTQIKIVGVSQKAIQELIDHLAVAYEFINKNPKIAFNQQRGCWEAMMWLPPRYVTPPKIIDESLATIPECVEEEFH